MISFQLIALILLILGLILLIVGIASPAWLDTEGYKQGLWRECTWGEDIPEECKTLDGDGELSQSPLACLLIGYCGLQRARRPKGSWDLPPKT